MNYKQRHQREQEFNERSSLPLDISGEIDILDLKVTIAYRLWQIEPEGVEGTFKVVGSENCLPIDFHQIVKDSLYEYHNELKGIMIYNLKQL